MERTWFGFGYVDHGVQGIDPIRLLPCGEACMDAEVDGSEDVEMSRCLQAVRT